MSASLKSENIKETFGFKNAISLKRCPKTFESKSVLVKILLSGVNVTFVPFLLSTLPISFSGLTASPLLKSILYSLPSLKIFSSSLFDRALTTETPTPCKPPETL